MPENQAGLTVITYMFVLAAVASAAPTEPIKVGDRLPRLSAKDTKGKVIQLSTFKGKVLYLDFVASW